MNELNDYEERIFERERKYTAADLKFLRDDAKVDAAWLHRSGSLHPSAYANRELYEAAIRFHNMTKGRRAA